MEFSEKLQELRKNKELTQEELAEALFVSRTAVSKWESGRGYPNIDSLKEISKFFSVSIDDLLSGEKILSIAEKENKSNIQNICDMLFAIVDIFTFILIILPIYPKTIGNYVYSVNLAAYTETTSFNLIMYWIFFLGLIIMGCLKFIFTQINIITKGSMILSGVAVIFLALAREAYAVIIIFALLVTKGALIYKKIICH